MPPCGACAPGTPGAMSIEGTAAGLVGRARARRPRRRARARARSRRSLPIVAGATVGALAESLLGATLEPPGILNNDVLNFLNTAIAAAAAIVGSRG